MAGFLYEMLRGGEKQLSIGVYSEPMSMDGWTQGIVKIKKPPCQTVEEVGLQYRVFMGGEVFSTQNCEHPCNLKILLQDCIFKDPIEDSTDNSKFVKKISAGALLDIPFWLK